jgi:hypothetical protein
MVWSDGQWWPARPFVLRAQTLGQFCRLAERAAELVLAACQRRAATVGELRDALGVPAGQLPLLDPDEPLSEHLLPALRPDIVTQAGQPKIVEVNIDGSIGGAPRTDRLAPLFLDFYRGTSVAAEAGLVLPPSSIDARTCSIRAWLGLGDGALVVIPGFPVGSPSGLSDPEGFARWQEPVCESGRRHGLDVFTYPLERLETDDQGRLLAGGRVVDAVLRLFEAASQPPSPGLDALARAVRARSVRMYTPEATTLLSNKLVLAWLWEDIGQLAAPDAEFVRRHIPWSARVRAVSAAEARARQGRLVLKMTGGFGGSGVFLGPTLSASTWRRALAAATTAGDGQYILQEYVDGDLIDFCFTHRETGETRTARVGFVIGPFVFSGKPAGVLVRHGTPGGDAVLNSARDAFPNTALLTQDDAGPADL